MGSPAQPFVNARDRMALAGRSWAGGDYLTALKQMLGMQQPNQPAQPMNWTPEPNDEQKQQIARQYDKTPQRAAAKNAVSK